MNNKQLYKSLMISISKIVKNKLNESSFDDLFDDIYDPDESFYDSSEIKDMFKIEHLIDCKTDADIICFLDERFLLTDILIKLIYDIINELKIKKDNFALSLLDKVLSNYSNQINYNKSGSYLHGDNAYQITIPIFENKGISFQIKTDYMQFDDIIYRGKPVSSYYLYMCDMNDNNKIILYLNPLYNELRGTGIQKYSIHIKNADHQKLISLKEDYNEKIQETLNNKLQEFILDYLINNLHVDKIADELTREGKVYEVKQKDYDRMVKCILTENFSGFDKITNADKMIARITAFFIAAKNLGYKNYELKLNDEAIFNYIFNDASYRTNYRPYYSRYRYGSYTHSKRHEYEYTVQMLLKIKQFPKLHLKDVLATYNAYKDSF